MIQVQLTYEQLNAAVSSDATGICILTLLESLGHPEDKVFPLTYSGGEYAYEKLHFHNSRTSNSKGP